MSGAAEGHPGYSMGPNPGPGGPAHPGHFSGSHPEMTPGPQTYQIPGVHHPGHLGAGFTGASGPSPSDISAPSTSSYRRWTPGLTAGAPPGGPVDPGFGQNGNGGSPGGGPGGGPGGPRGPYPAPSYPTGGPGGPPRGFAMHGPPGSGPSPYPSGRFAGYGGGYVIPGNSGTARPVHVRPPSANGAPSYDIVHLSARNARLEEKLSKALAKNRSMAKYYDTLLAKTRDAQEREVDSLKDEISRLMRSAADRREGTVSGAGGSSSHLEIELRDEKKRRQTLERELRRVLKDRTDRTDGFSDSAAADSRDVAESGDSGSIRAADGGSSSGHTLLQMRELLDQAREDRVKERKEAERRDSEMARQLTEIKERALERVRESTAAAREVAALKERCYASELERDRLREKVQELELDERDHRELRRMARDAERAAEAAREKADRCELAEARLRQEQAHVAGLRDERAQAHARTNEMTERLLTLTNEKDVLVRHSARQVHVEAELASCKEELDALKKSVTLRKTEAKDEGIERRAIEEGVGRVLRTHIYSHARWERNVSDEITRARDAHEHGQRSTVRLVAVAEREAAGVAGEAIESVRTARRSVAEFGAECEKTISRIRKTEARRADERIEKTLELLREADSRRELAEVEAESSRADARRARAEAQRAEAQRARAFPSVSTDPDSTGTTFQAKPDPGSDSRSGLNDDARLRNQLRVRQFQILGLGMWKRAAEASASRDVDYVRGQIELARRETQVATALRERIERACAERSANARWIVLTYGVLRTVDAERSARAEDVESALKNVSNALASRAAEHASISESLRRADIEIARLVRALDDSRLDRDDAVRRLRIEREERAMDAEADVDVDADADVDVDGDASFSEHPRASGSRKAMDVLFEAVRKASALAATASEDLETDGSVARVELEETLRACRDASLILADEDSASQRLRRAERERAALGLVDPNLSSAAAGVGPGRRRRETSARLVKRRALEIKAAFLAAALDGLDAKTEARRYQKAAGVSAARLDQYRTENAAQEMLGLAEMAEEKIIQQERLPGTLETASSALEEGSGSGNAENGGGGDRFGNEPNDPGPTLRSSSPVRSSSEPPAVGISGADAFSDPNQFSFDASSSRKPKVVHSPPSEPGGRGGGGGGFVGDPAEASRASLVRARARRAEALEARTANDRALEDMRERRASRPGEEKKGSVSSGKKKEWTPPPWDERPSRASAVKTKTSESVTNPYASKPGKAKVARRS